MSLYKDVYNTSHKKKKLFSMTHILIAVVAIIECVLLITISTYSWIESASSLVITNVIDTSTSHEEPTPMNISNQLDYQIDLGDASGSTVQLSTYYSYSADFQFSKASSYDGKTMFFPRKNNTSLANTKYRQGDTTDNNTSMIYLDFAIDNTTNSNLNYYFDKNVSDIFTFTNEIQPDMLSDNDSQLAAKCMRFSVSTSTSRSSQGNSNIFSLDSTNYSPVSSINSSGEPSVTSKTSSQFSQYFSDTTGAKTVFGANKNTKTYVSFRIWFDCTDPNYINTISKWSSDKYNALLGSNINVNLLFKNSANSMEMLYFDDFTFSNTPSNLGNPVTTDNIRDNSYKVYFHYVTSTTGRTSKVIPMAILEDYTGESVRWGLSDNGEIKPLLSANEIEDLENNSSAYTRSYFSYGQTQNDTSYTWYFPDNMQMNTQNEYSFSAYGYSKASNANIGCGVWGNTNLQLLYFKDMNTTCTSDSYNTGNNFKFIDGVERDENRLSLYVNTKPSFSNSDTDRKVTPALYKQYDSENPENTIWKTYVPSSWISNSNNLYFRYCSNLSYTSCSITWNAGTPNVNSAGSYTYTGLGTTSNALINPSSNLSAIGTWGECDLINLSTELIDNDIDSNNRFKISLGNSSVTDSYFMIPDDTLMNYYAYIPHTNYIQSDSLDNQLTFRMSSAYNQAPNVYWQTSKRDSSDILYPVSVSTSSNGYWHISVLCDETFNNLIYDSVTDLSDSTTEYIDPFVGGILQYSKNYDSGYIDLTPYRIDQNRWYVPNLTSSDDNVYYKWVPYSGTEFIYTQSLTQGIYKVISE